MDLLSFAPQRGARIVRKLINSAVANAEQNSGVDVDSLYILRIHADEGPICMKRHGRDAVMHLADIIGVNRYPGWYLKPGRIDQIEPMFLEELKAWRERYGKAVMVSEYGADTVAGFHQVPAVMFTEEFQVEFLRAAHRAFDACPFVIGEHVWNFADFRAKQDITRVDGNKKGVFTRDRRPKMAAHLLWERWRRR